MSEEARELILLPVHVVGLPSSNRWSASQNHSLRPQNQPPFRIKALLCMSNKFHAHVNLTCLTLLLSASQAIFEPQKLRLKLVIKHLWAWYKNSIIICMTYLFVKLALIHQGRTKSWQYDLETDYFFLSYQRGMLEQRSIPLSYATEFLRSYTRDCEWEKKTSKNIWTALRFV